MAIKRQLTFEPEAFFLTGATGFLGQHLVDLLLKQGKKIVALVLDQDPLEAELRQKASDDRLIIVHGDVADRESLRPFFTAAKTDKAVLIHAASLISIQSKMDPKLYRVNVLGCQNICDLVREYRIPRLTYVSSVHTIPEEAHGKLITEANSYNPDLVVGPYAKTKAMALDYLLKQTDLDTVAILPSGLIGPQDPTSGPMTSFIRRYLDRGQRFNIAAGYNFVDVRDVAKAVVLASYYGKDKSCYIISGESVKLSQIMEIISGLKQDGKKGMKVPLWVLKPVAHLAEFFSFLNRRKQAVLTRYAVHTILTNSNFSHEKASKDLGYQPRKIRETLRDIYLESQRRSKPL